MVGSVFACRWGTFGFLGPLTTRPDVWDGGVGQRLMEPVLEAFDRWELRQSALFTFPHSPKHIGLYQRYGFCPRFLTTVTDKPVTGAAAGYVTLSQVPGGERAGSGRGDPRAHATPSSPAWTSSARSVACEVQQIGDTVLRYDGDRLAGVAVCHCGAGQRGRERRLLREVRRGASRPGGRGPTSKRCSTRARRLQPRRASTASSPASTRGGSTRIAECSGAASGPIQIGVAMHARPEGPDYDGPESVRDRRPPLRH